MLYGFTCLRLQIPNLYCANKAELAELMLPLFFSSRTPATGCRSTGWNMEMEAYWTWMTCCVMWWMTKIGWVKVCVKLREKGRMCLHILFICLFFQTLISCFATSSYFHSTFPCAEVALVMFAVWNFVHKALAVLHRVSLTHAYDYTCLLLLSHRY